MLGWIATHSRKLLIVFAVVVAVLLIAEAFAVRQDNSTIGTQAHNFHSGPYLSIGFQLSYESSAPPDAGPVGRFLDFAHRYTGKATSASWQPFTTQSLKCWNIADAIALSENLRNTHSLPIGTLSVHYTFIDGYDCSSKFIAGATYSATSTIIFMPALSNCGILNSGCTADPVAEAAALSHEFGHMMGLCAIAMPDLSPAVCDGTGHALDPASLMASQLDLASPNVIDLTLEPNEVRLLNEL